MTHDKYLKLVRYSDDVTQLDLHYPKLTRGLLDIESIYSDEVYYCHLNCCSKFLERILSKPGEPPKDITREQMNQIHEECRKPFKSILQQKFSFEMQNLGLLSFEDIK